MSRNDDNEFPRPQNQLGEDEILIEHYTELRAEIRDLSEEVRTRESRSVASIALIIGYAFYAENGLILISLVPAVIGIAFIAHVGTTIWISRLAGHIIRIQNLVDVEEFCWEREYGMFSSGDLWKIPYLAFYVVLSVLYAASIVVSYRIVQRWEGTVLQYDLGYNPDPHYFLVFYVLLSVAVGAAAVAYFIDYRRNMPDQSHSRDFKQSD